MTTTPRLHDLEVHLPAHPHALAALTEALGRAGVSLEGGGAFGTTAHYLVADGPRALRAATATGLGPARLNEVTMTRVDQSRPGRLGPLLRELADQGVHVRTQYSDHAGNLVLVTGG
ncbi:hypothetical protein [Streptomyces sp. SID11385]|uniref:hypothetical protein n=1 Tax=Streptomyces sp. SID11385 TaxID=2706031 RepID=UPI0013CB8DFB|nr:hypothetical protein [Streptomyces sp. SID11385]NEA43186.1 hypothetical protein [Streptomyces sp. SID11385]